jgi:hypothetical protein
LAASFTNSNPAFLFMHAVNGVHTLDVNLAANPTFAPAGNSLTITDSGTASLDGGPAFAIAMIMTTQGPAGQPVSYSGTITQVPLPGALALFGSVIVGAWGWSRRRKSHGSASPELAAA